MFPEAFKKRIAVQNSINPDALLKALAEPSPVSIRINPVKWNRSPLNARSVPWSKNGFYLGSRPSYTFDPLFHSGCYYPQEASGMFLEQAIKQAAGSSGEVRVLDLCGAPGGKSTLISEIIGPDSLLVANEVIRSRALILAETVTKWGYGNTIVTQSDPSRFGRLQGYFDIIVVDAPCSGEGMFRDTVAVNEWSPENASHCSERQKRILMDVWPALKENGVLIYSTCTFNPGENEENIKWLIGNNDAECVRLDLKEFDGITEIDYQGIFGYGFYPDKIKGEGFFISVIRKTGKQGNIYIGNHKKNDFKPGKKDLEVAEAWTSFPKDRFLKWNDELYAVPYGLEDYFYLFHNLKVIKPGTKIFAVKNNDFLPEHELALSDSLRKDAFPLQDLSISGAINYLRRDGFNLPDAPKGWIIVTYMGVNLGFVKNIGKRLNNYFPVEWRIRMNTPESVQDNILKWNDRLMGNS